MTEKTKELHEFTIDNININLKVIQEHIDDNSDQKNVQINNLKYFLKGILDYDNKIKEYLEDILNKVDTSTLENLQEDDSLCEIFKKSNLFFSWLNTHFEYFKNENTSYTYKRTYKRRDIIKVDFGFNVGSELGGLHYALVVEKDDNISDSTLVVVPLSTFRKKGRKIDDLYPTEVDLGILEDLIENNDEIYSYALIDQIRLISKLRIHEPRNNKLLPARISNEQMDLIDEKIIHFFSNKNISPINHFDELDEIIYRYAEYKELGDEYEEHFCEKIHILHKKIFDK